MDAKLVYWTGALVNMAVIVALAGHGVRLARRGDVAGHRRAMLVASGLVLAFVASYALKLAFLGREAVETWSPAAIWVLRFHETCVLFMILGGAFALARAWRLRRTRLVTRDPEDPRPAPALLRAHRRAGRVAVGAALLGVLSACLVLAGMYARSGAVDGPALAAHEGPPPAE